MGHRFSTMCFAADDNGARLWPINTGVSSLSLCISQIDAQTAKLFRKRFPARPNYGDTKVRTHACPQNFRVESIYAARHKHHDIGASSASRAEHRTEVAWIGNAIANKGQGDRGWERQLWAGRYGDH